MCTKFLCLCGDLCVCVCVCLLPLIHPHPNILPSFGSRINMRWQFCVTLWIFDLCDVRRCGLIWKDYTGNEPLVWLPSTQKKKEEEEERKKKSLGGVFIGRGKNGKPSVSYSEHTYSSSTYPPRLFLLPSLLGFELRRMSESELMWRRGNARTCEKYFNFFKVHVL